LLNSTITHKTNSRWVGPFLKHKQGGLWEWKRDAVQDVCIHFCKLFCIHLT